MLPGQHSRLNRTLLFTGVLFWGVTLLIGMFDWEQGIWRALLLLLVLMTTPVLVRQAGAPLPHISQQLSRWLALIWAALFSWHVVILLLHLSEPVVNDSASVTIQAGIALLHGRNPYTMAIDPQEISAGIQINGYKYLPVMPVFYTPLGLLWGDRGILITNFVLDLGVVLLVMALAHRISQKGLIAVYAGVLYLLVPLVVRELYIEGDIDLALVVPLLLAILWYEERPGWAGVAVGLSISTKIFPGLLFVVCCLPGERRRLYSVSLLIGLLPILIFLIVSPQALWLNTVQFISQRETDSTSWMNGLPASVGLLSRAIASCTLFPMAAYIWMHRPPLLSRCAMGVMMIILVNLSSPVTHRNYMLWWIPLFAVVLGVIAFHLQIRTKDRNLTAG